MVIGAAVAENAIVPEDAKVRLVGPDPRVVEAALLRYPKGLTREALACGLGWTLDRLDRARAVGGRDHDLGRAAGSS